MPVPVRPWRWSSAALDVDEPITCVGHRGSFTGPSRGRLARLRARAV